MTRLIFSALFLCLSFSHQSTSASIECKYEYFNFNILGSLYHCDVSNDPFIVDNESAKVTSVVGTHEASDTDTPVDGFYIASRTIKHFPRGLENFLVDIKAIFITSCQLQEIHQSDLKPFSDLIYLSIKYNDIEVIEEGLFDFNPKLETVIFYESSIVHIDPEVFDNLPELTNLWFNNVPCINRDVEDSRDDVVAAIISMKDDCVSSDFIQLAEEFGGIAADLSNRNLVGFEVKLEHFETSLNSSKFFKFRPLNLAIQTLKSEFYSNYGRTASATSTEPEETSTATIPEYQDTVNISNKFEDLKSSQCGMSSFLSDLKASQESLISSFAVLKSSQNEIASQCSKNDLPSTVDLTNMTTSIDSINFFQNATATALQDIKVTQESLKSSHNHLVTSQEAIKSSQDSLHSSMSDMEVILSDLKKSQGELKDGLMKVKNSQNEVRISLNSMSSGKNEKMEEKLGKIEEKLGKFESNFEDFKADNAGKLDKIEKQLLNSRHRISLNLDEKIKGIEKRIVQRLEEVLEDKLAKILKN